MSPAGALADKNTSASSGLPVVAQLMVELPLLPEGTVSDAGDAETVRAVTYRLIVTVAVLPPPVPVTKTW